MSEFMREDISCHMAIYRNVFTSTPTKHQTTIAIYARDDKHHMVGVFYKLT